MKTSTAYIIPSLSIGGAEIQTIKHVNYLKKQGHDIFLIVLSNNVPLIDQVTLPDKDILLINKKQYEYNFAGIQSVIHSQGLISRFVKEKRINVILAIMPLAHFCGRLIKLQHRLKNDHLRLIIYHRAAFFDMNPADTLGKKLMKKASQWLSIKCDDHMIYISRHVRRMIEKNMKVTCSATVIYNSSDMPEIPEDEVTEFINMLGVKNKMWFLVPGRLHAAKGQDDLLNALALLQAKGSIDLKGVRVVVAGDGPFRQHLEQLTRELNLTENVIFCGTVKHDVLIGLNCMCDWVIIPSRAEGLGNVAIEAVMCQANILSSDAGGLKEVVIEGQTGYLFNSGDVLDLSEKLEKIITGNLVPLPAAGLQAFYENNFTIEAQYRELINLFEIGDTVA